MINRHTCINPSLALATIAILTSCQGEQIKIDDTINTYTVTREDLPINVKEGGELVAVNETVVRSLIEGRATILSLVPEGTLVKPGDKLVELDVSSLVDLRATQEISVEKARNEMEQARTAGDILEKELITKKNTADSQLVIATMGLEKLLGAKDGKGSEGKNSDMLDRLTELVNLPSESEVPSPNNGEVNPSSRIVAKVRPQNYVGLINKVTELLKVKGETGNPLQRDMGEMANKILQQADQIRLAMADLKVKEDTAAHSRRLAAKQFITRNELERDELAYQSQESKVTIAWNDLELLVNYTLRSDKIELNQNVANAQLEAERVEASNDAERKKSEFDVSAKQKEFEVARERLENLNKQIGNSVIYSPGSGLVVYSKVSRNRGDSEPVEEGMEIRERQSIIILPDNTQLECEVKVQEAMIDKVRVGLPAHISAEVRPNESLTGRVVYVAPVVDSGSRWGGNDKKVYTTKIRLDGVNKDEALKAGMKAAATITVDTITNVITAPIQAVRRDRAVNYVWTQTPTGPVAVAVKVGNNNQEKVEVLSGLKEGDVIYRTPPGGQAYPKFDQPALPEVPGLDDKTANASSNSNPDNGPKSAAYPSATPPGNTNRSSNRGTRKKYTEMSPAELTQAKGSLLAMPDRFGAMLDADRLDKLNKAIGDIVKAIDASQLEEAQGLRDKMMRDAMGGRGGAGGRRPNSGGGGQSGESSRSGRGGE